jgi:RNA polymerase sigma factor (sigma-70 family)
MSDGVSPATARAHEAARTAFPDVDLPREAFDRAWHRALERRPASADDPSRAADVFLATACDAGVVGAWDALVAEYVPRLGGLLRRRGAAPGEAADLLADLPGFLCSPPPEGGARTRIGTYDGTGHLFSWLAVVVLRRVHQRRRAPAVAKQAPLEAAGDPASDRGTPAQAVVGVESARRFEAAVAAAWNALTPRERLVVQWRFRDGLQGREIARVLGIGPPRVSRLLESGLTRLRDGVRRLMPETPPGTRSGEDSVWQALLGVLARHLATLPARPHDPGTGHHD